MNFVIIRIRVAAYICRDLALAGDITARLSCTR